jgi:hypothetical protein
MAIALSPNELERTIQVLASAGQTLQLTRFQRITYRTLLVSADIALASFLGIIIAFIFAPIDAMRTTGTPHAEVPLSWILFGILALVFAASFFVGIVSLALNIPLLIKTFREGRRLKRLGLSPLSTSLWKESRRSRWISRLRGVLFLVIGIILAIVTFFVAVSLLAKTVSEGAAFSRGDLTVFFVVLLFYGITAVLLFGARYLRNQRERMDLAASAGQLREALQSLQQREGTEFVSVPAEILERTAIIESAQIKQERKEAVLQSTTVRSSAYAVAFERDAAEQRSTLRGADRLELEDLVADLSTEGAQRETQASATSSAEPSKFQCATESKQVEIEYVVDHASRRIRVVAVKHGGAPSPASLNGASNG